MVITTVTGCALRVGCSINSKHVTLNSHLSLILLDRNSITPSLQYSNTPIPNEQHEDKTITIVEEIRKITLNLA